MAFSTERPEVGSNVAYLEKPEGPYRTQLEFLRTNRLGARIYEDGLRRQVVQMHNPDQPIGLEHPVVKFERDAYIDKEGTMYVLSTQPNDTNEFGTIQLETEAKFQGKEPSEEPRTPRGKSVLTRVLIPEWIPQDNRSIELFVNKETDEAFWRYRKEHPSEAGIITIYEFKDPDTPGKVVYLDETSERVFVVPDHARNTYTWRGGRDDFPLPRPHEHARVLRPTQLVKSMKNYFDGTGDPYDHVAEFKQVLRAEQVEDMFTQYNAFGLTLKNTALTWFQPLQQRQFRDIHHFLESFITEFSKSGIRHDTSSLIHSFKQTPQETVRLAGQLPSQAKQVSLFLDGLLSSKLRSYVYLKEPRTLEECVRICIDIEDNLGEELELSKVPKLPTNVRCYTCGGNHLENVCPNAPQPQANPSGQYCTIERRYTNHTAQDCPYNKQTVKQSYPQAYQQPGRYQGQYNAQPYYYRPPQNYPYQAQQRPQPVLAQQPPPPANVISVKYAAAKENLSRALVPSSPLITESDPNSNSFDSTHVTSPPAYYTESPEHVETYHYDSPPVEPSWEPDYANVMYANPNPRPQLRQQRPQGPRGPCFRCQGDHFIKDCPHPPIARQSQWIQPYIRACPSYNKSPGALTEPKA
ncbi:hypothetical protein KP509_22G010500 [Ceratopteris richardii]|uniref:Uncharacterized protein n=1 Tax=Ceratopteris richardii TaxID=49495 RepID=A0A8T2S3K9_CERRI|nr:hypothetical protein KP509_22G010500 [Ceratopteris richardii]